MCFEKFKEFESREKNKILETREGKKLSKFFMEKTLLRIRTELLFDQINRRRLRQLYEIEVKGR